MSLLLFCRELIVFCRELILFCRELILFCRELILFCRQFILFCRELVLFCRDVSFDCKFILLCRELKFVLPWIFVSPLHLWASVDYQYKVLYRRPQWQSILVKFVIATFTNYVRKRKLHVIQKKQVKNKWLLAHVFFINVLICTHLLLKPGSSEKKRTINWCGVDLQLSWLKAKWVNAMVASNTYYSKLVCVRKPKFLCLETDFHQSCERSFA